MNKRKMRKIVNQAIIVLTSSALITTTCITVFAAVLDINDINPKTEETSIEDIERFNRLSLQKRIEESMEETKEAEDVEEVADEVTDNAEDTAEIEEEEVQDEGLTYMGRTYSDEEVEYLARIGYFEEYVAGKEAVQLAVAVVINRSHWSYYRRGKYDDPIKDVFYQSGQYANWTKKKVESSESIEPEVEDWVRELLSGESSFGYDIPRNLVYQAAFRQGSGTYYECYNSYFCIESESALGTYIE